MKPNRITTLLIAGIIAATGGTAFAAPPLPRDGPSRPTAPARQVASDCYAVGQQVAAQAGGMLAAARPATRGGQAVCVVVVLIPSPDGKRPRRQEVVVPQ